MHHSHSQTGAQDKHDQQAKFAAKHYSHPGEPRAGMISRLEFQQGTTATYFLKDRHDQQARIAARHYSYSHAREAGTGILVG